MTEEIKETKSTVVPIASHFEKLEPLELDSVQVNPKVVQLLEDMLASAKRGEIHALFMVRVAPKSAQVYPGLSYAGISNKWANLYELFGALTHAAHYFEREWIR